MIGRGASILIVVASLLATAPAGAAECVGIAFPDQLELDGKALTLNGLGLREATLLKVDVYVAGLYLERKSSDPATILGTEQSLRFAMQFVRDVERDDIVEAFEDGYESAAENLDALRDRIATLNGWMPSIAEGDRMAFTYRPGKGLEIQVGETIKGTIPGADFARATLAIWLGDEPPNPEIKTGLLGGACG